MESPKNFKLLQAISFIYNKLWDDGKFPQVKELEEAVLGAVMIDKFAINEILDVLKDESFYLDAHQRIWRAIRMLFQDQAPIDLLTVTEQLKKNADLDAAGGTFYVSQLANKVSSSANVECHARLIAEKYIQRQLISTLIEIIKDACEDTTDVFELLEKAERNLYKIATNNEKRNPEIISSLMMKELKEIDACKLHSEDELYGVPSGFIDLDHATGGWQKSNLIIIAARPAMGNTAFVLSMANNAAIYHCKPITIFSLDLSGTQLVQRVLSMETNIPSDRIRRRNLDEAEYEVLSSKIDRLKNALIFIDDTSALNLFELRLKCRRLKHQHDIQLVIIDYLQLMGGGDDDKSDESKPDFGQVCRSLKEMAKELEIPVIVLSQLSRDLEKRAGDKKPILSDLRKMSDIEQYADVVVFLYRGEYYGIDTDTEGESTKDIAELIIAKNRNGPVRTVRARFINRFAKFENLDE